MYDEAGMLRDIEDVGFECDLGKLQGLIGAYEELGNHIGALCNGPISVIPECSCRGDGEHGVGFPHRPRVLVHA